jgi:hypothetical protein
MAVGKQTEAAADVIILTNLTKHSFRCCSGRTCANVAALVLLRTCNYSDKFNQTLLPCVDVDMCSVHRKTVITLN